MSEEIIKKTSTKLDILKEFLWFGFLTFVIVVPIRVFIAQPFVVNGSSMEPTFIDGDYLIVDQLSYNFNEPNRGDVIIFKFPENPSKFFIKRIIALPNETIEINDNKVFVTDASGNSLELDQSYIKYQAHDQIKVTVGADEYFVMGDNRAESYDSRRWGTLDKKFIMGKALFRLLPFNKIDYLPGSLE